MKVKSFFVAILATMAFVSCGNDTEQDAGLQQQGQSYMNFSLKFDASQLYSIDGDHSTTTAAPELTSVSVNFLDASDAVVGAPVEFTAATTAVDFGKLTTNQLVTIAVPSGAVKVKAQGNVAMTTATLITSKQGFNVVPVGGPAVTIDKTTPGTATTPYTATVTIAPELARFEVFGKMDVTTGANANAGLYSKVNVKAIYFNNFKMTSGATTLTMNKQTSIHSDWYSIYTTNGNCVNMFDQIATGTAGNLTVVANAGEVYTNGIGIIAGKASGYNFFAQSTTETSIEKRRELLPHIIVEVECWDKATPAAVVANKNFITVRSFKDATNAAISTFDAAMIYRLDLQTLAEWINGGGEPDPDPEQDGYFVNLTLTVTPWTTKNVFPEL